MNGLIMFVLLLSSIVIAAAHSEVTKTCPLDRIYSFSSSDRSSDRLASKFHLPLPEPYTDATTAHFYGASLMSPNSTDMPSWFYFEKGIQPQPFNESLFKQLQSFENLLGPYCFSHERCLQKLNKALIFFDQLGVNDYQHMLLHGKSILDVSKLVPQVVEAIKGKLEGLI